MANKGIFNPQRLTVARQCRGLTKLALANAVDLTPRTITNFERGEGTPDSDIIDRLATALSFPRAFFSRADLASPDLRSTSFRALSRMTARTRDQALGFGSTALALSEWLDQWFITPEPNVPHYQSLDPSLAAAALRRHWRLGQQPLPNLIQLAETNGVRIFSLPQDLVGVDAFSFWIDQRPYIFLNTHKSTEHSRFDIAHELGHLTMHWQGIERSRLTEQQAQEFGSVFLMPEEDITGYCHHNPALSDLIELKERWGVSVAALAYRLHNVGFMTDWRYRAMFIEISKHGYRTSEPRPRPPEVSAILSKVLQVNAEEGRTRADIAADLAISLRDLHDITFGLAPVGPDSGDQVARAIEDRHRDSERPNFRIIKGGNPAV